MPPPCVKPNREGFCANPAPFFLQTVVVGFTSLFVSLGFVVVSKPLVAVETLEELFLPPGLIPDNPGLPVPGFLPDNNLDGDSGHPPIGDGGHGVISAVLGGNGAAAARGGK